MRRALLPASAVPLLLAAGVASATPRFEVTLPAKAKAAPIDGRLLLILSNDPGEEPRMQVDGSARTQQLFGIDALGWKPGERQVIQTELIPYLEKKYRALGTGWSRFVYGGSTGGWEAMAVQTFYPDFYNGAYIACPDPIDFRAYTVIDLYKDRNAFYTDSFWKRTPRAGTRDGLGRTVSTIAESSRRELVLGTHGRSGEQWDIWQAVYSPVGPDGYPAEIWDKRTGVIDHAVAEYWKQHYDLMDILRRDWQRGLGDKLRGKLHIYVGTMDTYFLDGAVHLAEEFLAGTRDPPYDGVVAYGPGFEHCWNGDPDQPNAISRLRYHEMFVPRIVERIRASAPAGADLTSWRY